MDFPVTGREPVVVDAGQLPDRSERAALPFSATSPAHGRRFTADVCARWGVPVAATDDAVLAVSELLTNAYLHGRSASVLTAALTGRVLRTEVADDSPLLPTRRQSSVEASCGRGLLLVEALTSRWGWTQTETGKVVWFEIDT